MKKLVGAIVVTAVLLGGAVYLAVIRPANGQEIKVNGGGGGGGTVSCSGDLNAGCSQVIGLSHTAAGSRVVGQACTVNGDCLSGLCSSLTCAVTPSGFPVRKTATDASSYLYWTLDEAALPMANGVVAQGSAGNFDTNGNVAFTGFNAPAFISTGPYCFTANRCGAQASGSTALSPALPISVWYWYKPLATSGACNANDGLVKAYRAAGSWTAPFGSIFLDISNTCNANFSVAVAGTLHTVTTVYIANVLAWNLLWGTYDGVNECVGINSFPPTCAAQAGAIDYNGNVGRWIIGVSPDNATSHASQFDEVHVDSVARSASYFATVYQTATGQGGN